jgi:hypothetical protein
MSNRELLVALAQGKKMRMTSWVSGQFISMSDDGDICIETGEPYCLPGVVAGYDWQEVVEPLRWEGEVSVTYNPVTSTTARPNINYITVPPEFYNKRVRVRIEEII